ncbi:Pyruvate oxidase [Roseomonas mucosa]|uniref:Pyruvate oxidase n=1 Tax=Roseomonas mucosa TaxID=207340 RepID=A0A4Y1MVS4_9PROT|nr:thiamine pyrophosphate-requiring protein [Roseomonas mucosa]AWV22001.1 Pyruvate oxidase [Roseomonas mucosa]MDT8356577.1 thiamine pyrophosphate-requiring protein [Roseomonas mucosa]MDU7522879.1 thiamine pyrophosphate-requiring protein [Roseomonas mucosa]QDJ08924.1 Pyruvate oxidase [Roseomonas mucosa]
MAKTVGDQVWERLREWGVRRVFGYPGDGINGLIGGLARHNKVPDRKIDFVQARHEEMAAFMAGAHAKFTGEVGVCIATSGPGAVHLLNGLYDARADHQPVLALVGQQARAALGGHFQQEIDLQSLYKDVARAFVQTAMVPEQVRHLVDRAMRIAMGERAVTALIFPNDLQDLPAVEDLPRAHGIVPSGSGYSAPRVVPGAATLERAAEVLNSGSKVAMLIGAGALEATDEVIAVADKLQAGAAKALLGKAALPDDLPWVTGSIGLLGTKPSWNLMQGCDTLLMVGSSFPYSEFLPKEGAARGVQIDMQARNLSIRYPMEVNLEGDAAATLSALLPMLEQKTDTSWRDTIAKDLASWWDTLKDRAMQPADPINPQRIFWELSPRLPDGVIITGDSGSHTNWYARDVKMRRGMMASLSGGLATMGSGMPYAIGAKFAHPRRPVLAICGDGAFQMNGMAELITVAKYWKEWESPQFVAMVLNNRDLNQVTWEQRVMEGDPKYLASQDIPDVAYARFAEMIGLKGIEVHDPEKIGAAWEEAFASDRPVVVEFRADGNVPPLPPHITMKQALAFTRSMAGEPELGSVIKDTFRQVASSVLPHRS